VEGAAGAATAGTAGAANAAAAGFDAAGGPDAAAGTGGGPSCTAPRTVPSAAAAATLRSSIAAGLAPTTADALAVKAAAVRMDAINERDCGGGGGRGGDAPSILVE